ncbi:hypothetical protein [Moorena sp. SIO3B2]|nr:hypothetical protein [Moorena sp. SIO3B2]
MHPEGVYGNGCDRITLGNRASGVTDGGALLKLFSLVSMKLPPY